MKLDKGNDEKLLAEIRDLLKEIVLHQKELLALIDPAVELINVKGEAAYAVRVSVKQ